MKKKFFEVSKILAVFNRKKDIFAVSNTKKDIFAVSNTKKNILAILKNKIKFIAVFLILILITAILVGFLGSKEASEEISAEEKKTESVQKDNEEEKSEDPDTGNLENHLASDFIKTLRAEKYMIRYKTTTVYEGNSFEVETTYAVSGDSAAMVSADRATIIKDNKVYMLNHTDKTMISWDVNHTEGLKRIDTEGMVYRGNREEGGLVW